MDKVSLMKFLRDEKRICWLEIYLKVLASSARPLLCKHCKEYYTVSQSGMCRRHTVLSSYNVYEAKRTFPCCMKQFVFNDLAVASDEALKGCQTFFHEPEGALDVDLGLIVPRKYMVVKDDLPGDEWNELKHPGTD